MVAEVLIVNGDALSCAIGRIPEAGSEDPAPRQVNAPVATRTPSRRFRNPEPRFPKLRAPTPNPGTNELPSY